MLAAGKVVRAFRKMHQAIAYRRTAGVLSLLRQQPWLHLPWQQHLRPQGPPSRLLHPKHYPDPQLPLATRNHTLLLTQALPSCSKPQTLNPMHRHPYLGFRTLMQQH
mmetsp:Transcript_17649/g.49231  ORF Transcript_17649/g.49231 Transcript_17649/m.49231 type:complete len:107 (+) Transcript_17649:366-686(+)